VRIQREHALQRQILRFVGEAVRVPHMFACHDRGRARSEYEHIHEAERGIRAGWPDTELCLNDGITFRCELKDVGKHVVAGSAQDYVLGKLNMLGHRSTVADSVKAYGEACERFGVPLRGNWRTLAQLADERVAADIREQEVKEAAKQAAEPPPAEVVVLRPKPRRRPSPAQIKRVFGAMKPL